MNIAKQIELKTNSIWQAWGCGDQWLTTEDMGVVATVDDDEGVLELYWTKQEGATLEDTLDLIGEERDGTWTFADGSSLTVEGEEWYLDEYQAPGSSPITGYERSCYREVGAV